MRALPVRPEPLWLIDFHQRITVSLWFVPTMFAAAAIGAANLTIWLDTRIAGTAGVVSATDFHGLVTLCRRKKCWLELTVGAGEYLVHGTPIALVHGAAALDGPEVSKFFLMRGERTFVQDPAFGFRQLVDIAIRALSPAVNDPTTAVQAIDRISDLLAISGTRPDPTGLLVDSEGAVRVKQKLRNFDGRCTRCSVPGPRSWRTSSAS